MHICLFSRIIHEHGSSGGMEIFGDQLSRHLLASGHKLTVITTAHASGKTFEIQGNKTIHYLPGTTPAKYTQAWWKRSVEKFLILARREPVDLVWSQSAGALGWLKHFGTYAPIPSVAIMQGVPFAWMLATLKNLSSPFLLPHLTLAAGKALYTYLVWERSFRHLTAAIVVNPQIREAFHKYYALDLSKIIYIPNGVDTKLFQPLASPKKIKSLQQKYSIGLSTPVLLLATRLVKEKGVQYAIQALPKILAQHSQTKLLILGTGKYQASLEQQASRLGVQNQVIFAGAISHTDLPSYLQLADVFLMPTLWLEGTPLSLLEAMACGKAIVASHLGGIPFVIDHQVNGLLVSPRHADEIASQVNKLLQHKALARRLAQKALAKARSEYALDQILAKNLSIFETLVQNR